MSTFIQPYVKIVNFKVHKDTRGALIALEEGHEFPFVVRRVYYIFGTLVDISRGKHAHRLLKQLLVATSGSVNISCEWDGNNENFKLDSPDKGLLIEGLVWREMHHFTSDAVLMVLADAPYSESDYIRNYDDFLRVSK